MGQHVPSDPLPITEELKGGVKGEPTVPLAPHEQSLLEEEVC
jgi:hypothetical protein